MADGIFPTLISRTRDANADDNVIFVQLSDGTTTIGVTGTSLDVNLTNTSIAVTATDLDIRDLTHASDSIKVGDGTDFLEVNGDGSINITDNGGSLTVDGTVAATQSGTWTIDSITNDVSIDDGGNSITVDATDLDIRDIDNATDDILIYGWDGAANQKIKTNAAGNLEEKLVEHTLTNANALPVSKNNAANSETNPIYVQPVTTGVSGTEIHNYDTSTVTADTADNHDYTVAGTTFLLKSIIVAGSGAIKFEVKVGALAGLVTKAVGFLTGRAGDSKQIFFEPAIEVPATGTGTVRVIRTNRENQTNDVYSTIIGNDV